MCLAMRNLCRLDDARFAVIAFDARNRDQRTLRRRLLEEIDLAEEDCRPGRERAFVWSWDRIEGMRVQLESPELAWKPLWISRVLYDLWERLVGARYRLLGLWWRLRGRYRELEERMKALRWAIEARLW